MSKTPTTATTAVDLPDTREFLTVAQAAAIAQIHPQTMYAAIRDRRCAHVKLGTGRRSGVRIARADLDVWLSANRVEAIA